VLFPGLGKGVLDGQSCGQRAGLCLGGIAGVELACFQEHPYACLADVAVEVAVLQARPDGIV
jgi:hypothetical protein